MIRWTETAANHLESIWNYIESMQGADAASAAVARIVEGISRLEQHPQLGRQGRATSTRELVIAPYTIVYHQRESAVVIDSVLHGSRRL